MISHQQAKAQFMGLETMQASQKQSHQMLEPVFNLC